MSGRRWSVRDGDNAVMVEIGADGQLTVEGVEVVVTALDRGEWLVASDDGSTRVFAAGPSHAPWIWHDGVVYRPEVLDPRERAARRRETVGDLSAPMPATVRAIHVSAGDAVTRGQTLVVLEAMKMELPLKAPDAGVVAEVACRVGELVQPGVPLVKLR